MKKKRRILSLIFKFLLLFPNNSLATEKKLLMSLTPTTPQQSKHLKKQTLIIFDTARKEHYGYSPLIEMARSNNFYVKYCPISTIIDRPINYLQLENYDCAMFILCPEFLKTMQTSPISRKNLNIIRKFAKMPNKMTVLMFPPVQLHHPNPMAAMDGLFGKLGLSKSDKNYSTFQALTNRFLQLPMENRPRNYHTTLNLPKPDPFGSIKIDQNLEDIAPVAFLPIKKDVFDKKIESLFPFGIYYYNPKRKNHVVISSSSLLCTGISENFQLCPLKFKIRKQLHNATHEFIWELNKILSQNKTTAGIDTKKIFASQKNELPHELMSLGHTNYKKGPTSKPYKVAWMEIKEHKKTINYILSAGLDSLWITINPQMYYSPIAKLKNDKQKFLTNLSSFTSKLFYGARKRNIKPPSILVGFEITNNVYAPNLPTKFAYDAYGNSYPDIPSPLDKNFWQNEVIDPLNVFLKKWKNPNISNGIKISGVVLDLEMYGRKTTGSYLPTMGFEPSTIISYLKPPLINSVNPELFSKYLIDNNLSSHYFAYLENQAENIGRNLRKEFSKKIRNVTIGCYAPSISVDWFYKGFYKGLSSQKRPLHLFTFNAEFASHKKWLERNSIYSRHLGVLMLSKIKNPQDLKLVDHVLRNHDGIWINRFSRLAEPLKKDWTFLENTPLVETGRTNFVRYLQDRSPKIQALP